MDEWFGLAASTPDAYKRKEIMDEYFNTVLAGYRSETNLSDSMIEKLPLFLKLFGIETILWEFENMHNEGQVLECSEELSYHLKWLESDIPYWGFFHEIYSSESPFEYEARNI